MSRILIALGGNALGDTPDEQKQAIQHTSKYLAELVEKGHEIIIVHGNGPQVGMIEESLDHIPVPFPECTAMSQGYIGYHLQNNIYAELEKKNISKNVITTISQVVVDKEDKAFQKPTKPIGRFYTKEEAKQLEKDKSYEMVEDSGRGYRRVVPSPEPVDIVEKESVKELINNGNVVITAGGGGIPVIKKEFGYEGIDAVVDKDLASGKVAELLDADYLFILTAVDKVAINFGKPNQKNLDKMSIEEANQYIKEEQFGVGSMLPKVIAAMNFVKSKPERQSIIASLEKIEKALIGESGTMIYDKTSK